MPTSEAKKELDGLRIMVTALLHVLGGSVVITETELLRVIDGGFTVNVTQDALNNYYLKEVKI